MSEVATKPPMIFKKMSDVMKDIKAITKDQKNTAQGFKFRGIDQFVNALYPALTKHGVFMAPSCKTATHDLKDVVRSNGKAGVDKHVYIEMNYTFYAEDGSWVNVGPIPAEGLDSGDKATNKALSAALKYALIQTFSIPTEDMAEADLETPEISRLADSPVVNTKKATAPVDTAVEVTVDTSKLNVLQPVAPVVTMAPAPAKLSTFRKPKPVAPVETAKTENTNTDGWT